jgi:hypothetical protein
MHAALHRVVAQTKIAPGTVRPSSPAAYGTKGLSTTKFQLKKAIHNTKFHPISFSIGRNDVIQRISEEDMVQAQITIAHSATGHGYSAEYIRSIITHRFHEIQPGQGRELLIGAGADDRDSYRGRIVYNCEQLWGGEYRILVFHAHGGQTEPSNPRGY